MSWTLFQNSILVAGGTTLLAAVGGIAVALLAAGLPRPARLALLAMAIAAFVIPPFLVTNTWMNYFGLTGTWRPYLDFDIYSLKGTIFVLALLLWPVPFFFSFGALNHIDKTYLEQEPALQSTHLLRYLLWPHCRAAILQALALTFVLALNNFSVPSLLQTKVYPEELWLSFITKLDYIEALKLSWPMILAPMLLLLVFRSRPQHFVFRARVLDHQLFRQRCGSIFSLALILSMLVVIVSLVLPLAQLLSSSRTWAEFGPAIAAGRNAAWNSFLFGVVPAFIVVLGGLVLTFPGANKTIWIGILSWFFFLMPGVLLAIGLIWTLNRPGLVSFYQSAGVVLLAFFIRYFAIGWTGARVSAQAGDRSLADVIATFGGSRWAQFRFAAWPKSKYLLLGTFYIVYLLCLWEVETLVLIVPPGRETLALRVFNMLHYGHASQVDALCVWLLIFALVPLCVFISAINMGRMARVLSAFTVLLLLGCDSSPQNETHLESKFFRGVQIIGTRGTGAGQFNKPRSVALDRNDNLYVVDMTGRVQKFSPDGQYVLSWQMPQTEKGKPKGMVRDSDGNIIVVEPHYSRVTHFDSNGKLVAQWGENGTNVGQLVFPRSVAVNSRGEIYLSEYGMAERINRFSKMGRRFLGMFGVPGTGPGELNRAEGLGVGPDDSVYVADSCNHRVQIFSPEGKFIAEFGKAGSGPGEMSYPYDVRVDPAGNRFVCEFGNSRVQVFDAQNRPIEIIGGAGVEPGQMNNPWAIAFDSHGNLYVADSANHRVQKFIRRDPLNSAKASVAAEVGARERPLISTVALARCMTDSEAEEPFQRFFGAGKPLKRLITLPPSPHRAEAAVLMRETFTHVPSFTLAAK
jgi:ABC-type Fe3+ transport system permease subunit/DNA-binding beta-propeller fold protein YncE